MTDKPDAVGTDCKECGMFVKHPAEYHTFVYCCLMKQLRDGNAVRSNIDFTVENHPFVKKLTAERDRLKAEVEAARERLQDFAEDVAYQYAYERAGCLTTGGLSTMETTFNILGWDDPHKLGDSQ